MLKSKMLFVARVAQPSSVRPRMVALGAYLSATLVETALAIGAQVIGCCRVDSVGGTVGVGPRTRKLLACLRQGNNNRSSGTAMNMTSFADD